MKIVDGVGWYAITIGKTKEQLDRQLGKADTVLLGTDKGGVTYYARYMRGRIEAVFREEDPYAVRHAKNVIPGQLKVEAIYFYQVAQPVPKLSHPQKKPVPVPPQKHFRPAPPKKAHVSGMKPKFGPQRAAPVPVRHKLVSPPVAKIKLPPFQGKTSRGVGLNSTLDDVLGAYGQPLKIEENSYHYRGIRFFTRNNKVERIAVHSPETSWLRPDYGNRIRIGIRHTASQGSIQVK